MSGGASRRRRFVSLSLASRLVARLAALLTALLMPGAACLAPSRGSRGTDAGPGGASVAELRGSAGAGVPRAAQAPAKRARRAWPLDGTEPYPSQPPRPPPLAVDGGAPSARFVAVGDTGKGNEAQARVATAMAQVCAERGCDFVVLLGDNFYPDGVGSVDDPQWETAFVAPYAALAVPFFAALGNHDYGGNGAGTDFARAQHQVTYSSVDAKWRMPATHFAFAHGPVDLFMADTNRSMFFADGAEGDALDAWAREARAPWRIVVGHHPYRSNGRHGNAGVYDGLAAVPLVNGVGVARFVEAHVCGRADLYLSGHDHSRQWLVDTCRGTELVVSGAGADPTDVPGTQPAHFQSREAGFLYVFATDERLEGTFYDARGAASFTRTLERRARARRAGSP